MLSENVCNWNNYTEQGNPERQTTHVLSSMWIIASTLEIYVFNEKYM